MISTPVDGDYFGFSLDPGELKTAALFWDRLDCPTNNAVDVGLGGDAAFLAAEGILQRTTVEFRGTGEPGQIFAAAHKQAFRTLDESQPGRWSIGGGVNSVRFRDEELVEGRGVLFELHNAIPVPDRAVHLADVLEFKNRRSSELLQLRHHLERLYQAIIESPDKPLSEATEFADLDRALQAHLVTSKESGLPIKLSTVSVKLDLNALLVGAAAAGIASAAEFSALAVALAGLGGTVGKVFGTIGITGSLRDRKPSSSPFDYVSRMRDELL